MDPQEIILTEELLQDGWLKTPAIIDAFKNIHRNDFVLPEFKDDAFINTALPIGFGQTISQPLVVAFMLELLQPLAGQKILEIGYGSGWKTCLLAYIVGQKGKVFAFEIITEIFEFGATNISKYNFLKKGIVECFCEDANNGFPKQAPFDRVIAAASAKEDIPQSWRNQLKIGGRIVAPAKDSIWLLTKKSKNEWEEKEYPGFAFVPLVKKEQNGK